jgi:hypothetical protein
MTLFEYRLCGKPYQVHAITCDMLGTRLKLLSRVILCTLQEDSICSVMQSVIKRHTMQRDRIRSPK